MTKSVIKGHITSKKHSANKEKLAKAKKREMDIAEALDKFGKDHHPKGETLPTPTSISNKDCTSLLEEWDSPLPT